MTTPQEWAMVATPFLPQPTAFWCKMKLCIRCRSCPTGGGSASAPASPQPSGPTEMASAKGGWLQW